MRIAWVTYDFEEYSSFHVNALCKAHKVLLVMPKSCDGQSSYSIDSSVEHCSFSKPRLRQPLRQWRSVRKLLQRIHHFRPDVVHFQQGHVWFNLVLGALRRYPLVVTIHNPRHHAGDVVSRKTPQRLLDYGFRKADHIIVHGDALAAQVENLFGFKRECIHVIPHVAMGDEAAGSDIKEDGNLVLFFGRIWDYKGLDQLIVAQPMISEKLPEARIMIAGEGEDFGKYRAMMKDPSKFIVHNTRVSDEQRASFFQRASIVVLPYNEATQTGVVPVAYNYQKPVVATRVGSLPECIDDGVTGVLIPPRDPKAIADAVVDLLKDRRRLRQMGQAGKAKLDRECSPQIVAEQTAAVYQIAVNDRASDLSDSPAVSSSISSDRDAETREASACES